MESDDKLYIVYKITCLVNGRVYIGATGKTAEERFKEHWVARYSPKFERSQMHQDMSTFDKDAFTVETIESGLSLKEVAFREDYWINKFSDDGYLVYNQKGGGGSIHLAEEQEREIVQLYEEGLGAHKIAKIVNRSKPAILSALNRNDIETRDRMPAKEVFCVESGIVYESIAEAAKQLGLSAASLSSCCHYRRKSVGGLHFCFLEDKDTFVIQGSKTAPKKVLCVETGVVYSSVSEAARELGLGQQHISACCLSKRNHTGGLHFYFEEDRERFVLREAANHPKGIYCIETDTIYESAHEAARQLNLHSSNISACCLGKHKSAGGYHFCFPEDKDTFTIQESKSVPRKVLCIETNVIYPSVREAARQLGVHSGNISACCREKKKSTGGYHFRYIDDAN